MMNKNICFTNDENSALNSGVLLFTNTPFGLNFKKCYPECFYICSLPVRLRPEYGGEHTEEVLQRGGALKVLPRLIYTLNSLIQVFKIKP